MPICEGRAVRDPLLGRYSVTKRKREGERERERESERKYCKPSAPPHATELATPGILPSPPKKALGAGWLTQLPAKFMHYRGLASGHIQDIRG